MYNRKLRRVLPHYDFSGYMLQQYLPGYLQLLTHVDYPFFPNPGDPVYLPFANTLFGGDIALAACFFP